MTAPTIDRTPDLRRLADAEDANGRPTSARLARIVAEAEALLHDTYATPMDPAWDEDDWWPLARTTDRGQRADILTALHNDWAVPQFGVKDSAILLRLAVDERAAQPAQEDAPTAAIPVEPDAPPPAAAPAAEEPSTELRDLLSEWAPRIFVGSAFLSLAFAVALVPNYDVKFFAGLALIVLVLGVAVTNHRKAGKP